MCGLTFIHESGAEEANLRACSADALERLQHRGPDGHGLSTGPGWAAGHRRLSIIDIGGSSQPMWDPAHRYCLTYNGEVYNYRQLRSDLEGKWDFSTQGDTEVVLAGLVLYGPDFFSRMEGMWALALWDSEAEVLLLARDRMGKKPLFYSASSKGISCASEIPALRALAKANWQEDLDSTADYLRYGYFLPGYTAWREVREVLPGHFAWWSPGKAQPEQFQYWQLQLATFSGSQKEAAETLRHEMVEAVRRRMVADVEVGAFLSGGVDSTLVCAIVRTVLGLPLKSFTIGFSDPSYDEREYASRAAKHLGTTHFAEELGAFCPEDLERLQVAHLGMPFHDSSILPTALVSRVAASHVKVALSGDGGDELFSGYQRYQARAILRWYTKLPQPLRQRGESLLRALPEPDQHHSRNILKKAHLFCDVADRLKEETPYIAPIMFQRSLRLELAPDIVDRGHAVPQLLESARADDLLQMMYADALVYLPQDILTKVDRASMAASLEARAPFLDRTVVELAFSMPRSWHRRGMRGKRMLQMAFGDLLPGWTWNRRKQGFGVPLQQWFRHDLGRSLEQLAQEPDLGPLNATSIMRLLDQHRAGTRDRGNRLWLIYSYLRWRNRPA
jgi:asparagine synthase (glutamine-hydrolysing)